MTLATVTVSIATSIAGGAGLPNGVVQFQLTKADVNAGIVTTEPILVRLDANGNGTVQLWPNALGTQGSQYRVTITDAAANQVFDGVATIPNLNCNLQEVLNLTPPPALSDAQAAQQAAQAAAALSQDWATQTSSEVVVGQGYGAKKYAADASASALSASDSAGSAAQCQAAANASASAAAGSANAASASAGAAASSRAQMLFIVQGSFDPGSPPTLRNDGTPVQAGDYASFTDNLFRRYNGTTWVASDINTANLAAPTGTTEVGHKDPVTGSVATTASAFLNLQVKGLKRTFGGVNDGATDNATQWANAINSGKTIEIEEGTFNISAGATITTPRQHIVGQSRSAIIQCVGDVDALAVGTAGQDASFVKVENVYFLGAAANLASTTAGIRIVRSTRSKFEFIRCENFGYGLTMAGATSNWVNKIDHPYMYQNRRAGIYWCGHATKIVGGEIAGSVFGVLQAALQAGSNLYIDRDFTGTLGEAVSIIGTTLESLRSSQILVTGAANNGSGLVRLTAPSHGCSTGDVVSVNNVTGTTEANGVWPVNVIDANTLDLKTSTFANAYVSGGYVYRGAAIYSGIGFGGVRASELYLEDAPIVYVAGDSFKNDGVTPHSTLTNGGCLRDSYIGETDNSAAYVFNRVERPQVVGNTAAATSIALLHGKNANYSPEIEHFGNYGFTREYEATGTQPGKTLTLKPTTRNGDVVLEVQLPASTNRDTPLTALQIGGYTDSTYMAYLAGNLFMGRQIGLGAQPAGGGTGVTFASTQSLSTNATTFDDYREGTYTGSLTGCTTVPTGTVSFTKAGGLVTIDIPQILGTSNDVTCTLTGMPTTIRPSAQRAIRVRAYSNGSYLDTGTYGNIGTDGTLTLYTSTAGGGWVNSGGKGLLACTATYMI